MPTAFVGLMVYQNLRDRYGYNHHMVNHKCNFVNPEVLRNVPYKGHRGERRVARRVLIRKMLRGLMGSSHTLVNIEEFEQKVMKKYCMRHIMYRIMES